jgi:uncharacterized delta-60 repeat protein
MKNSLTFAILASCLVPIFAHAANGDLDLTFGNSNGIALTGTIGVSNTLLTAPVIQPDGKILLCNGIVNNGSSGSDFLVVQFNPDGSLDNSFSFDGRATIDFDGGTGNEQCSGLGLQSDGKIVVSGFTRGAAPNSTDFAIARLNTDGTLDTSFGAGTGKTTVAFDLMGGVGDDTPTDMLIQPDGKIVVAGTVATTANGTDFALVRLLADGTRDPAFNLTGKVTFGFDLAASTNKSDAAAAIALDDAGRIVIAGTADNGPTNGTDFAVARVLPNGQLDADFHSNGRTTIAFDIGMTRIDQLFGMTVQRDGKIVVVGDCDVSPSATPNVDMSIARLLPDGSLDSSFGINGKTLVSFDLTANGGELGLGVTQQPNGKLLIVGAAFGASNAILGAAVRLNQDGTPDQGFGTLGKHTYDFGLTIPSNALLRGVTIKGGTIIASGLGGIDTSSSAVDMFLVRLQDDGIFADGFE